MMGDSKSIKIVRPFWKTGLRRATTEAVAFPLSADELQHRYLRSVLHYVAGRVGAGEAAEAEDITAEVFAAAFACLHKCPAPNAPDGAAEDGSDPVRAWLFGIARRKIADSFRRRTRRPQTQTALPETHSADAQHEPEPNLLADEARRTLHDLLADLPELQREAIWLRYIDGLSVDDIAQVLNKSPNATAQLLHRARQTLRTRGAAYFNANAATETHK